MIQLSCKRFTHNLLPSHLTLTHGPNGQFHSYIMAEKHIGAGCQPLHMHIKKENKDAVGAKMETESEGCWENSTQ